MDRSAENTKHEEVKGDMIKVEVFRPSKNKYEVVDGIPLETDGLVCTEDKNGLNIIHARSGSMIFGCIPSMKVVTEIAEEMSNVDYDWTKSAKEMSADGPANKKMQLVLDKYFMFRSPFIKTTGGVIKADRVGYTK